MKIISFFLTVFLLSACTSEPSKQTKQIETELSTVEVVDFRVFNDGKIRLNGEWIGEAGLGSHIQSLPTSKQTKARVIFDEDAPFSLITKIQSLLHKKQINQIAAKPLTHDEFVRYNQNVLHIDVLNSGKILYQGNLLHIADLEIALTNKHSIDDTEVILTIGDEANFGTVYDVQKTLALSGHKNMSTQDIPEYRY